MTTSAMLTRRSESGDRTTFIVFIVLQLTALVGAVLILVTVCVSKAIKKRHPIWINFIFSWIVYSLSYTLLVGTPVDDTSPNSRLCFAQAVLVYIVPSMASAATTSLVFHVLITVRSLVNADSSRSYQFIMDLVLFLLPYIPAGIMGALASVTGTRDPDTIYRDPGEMYCHMRADPPGRVSAILTAVFTVVSAILEIIIFFHLRRHWRFLSIRTPRSVSMFVRVLLFGLCGIAAFGLSLVWIATEDHRRALSITLAAAPVAVVVIFGTQQDIIDSWKAFLTGKPIKTQINSTEMSSMRLSASVPRTPRDSQAEQGQLPPGYKFDIPDSPRTFVAPADISRRLDA